MSIAISTNKLVSNKKFVDSDSLLWLLGDAGFMWLVWLFFLYKETTV